MEEMYYVFTKNREIIPMLEEEEAIGKVFDEIQTYDENAYHSVPDYGILVEIENTGEGIKLASEEAYNRGDWYDRELQTLVCEARDENNNTIFFDCGNVEGGVIYGPRLDEYGAKKVYISKSLLNNVSERISDNQRDYHYRGPQVERQILLDSLKALAKNRKNINIEEFI